MTGAELQRWSRDVAEDPGSPSFVPLARAYRRQGRRDAALRVLLRGLERNPEHVDAHALLALLHVDAGEHKLAGDEWEIVLRLDPGNFDASRGLGFLALERGDLKGARRHLQAAARARPDETAVREALEILSRRETAVAGRAPGPGGARPVESGGPAPEEVARPPAARDRDGREPSQIFEALGRDAPFLGALLLDRKGLLLAGALADSAGAGAEALGGLLSPAVEEARRTASMLDMGAWEGMMVECDRALLHLAPVGDSVLLLAARSDAPAGWVVRTAARARELALRFLEVGS